MPRLASRRLAERARGHRRRALGRRLRGSDDGRRLGECPGRRTAHSGRHDELSSRRRAPTRTGRATRRPGERRESSLGKSRERLAWLLVAAEPPRRRARRALSALSRPFRLSFTNARLRQRPRAAQSSVSTTTRACSPTTLSSCALAHTIVFTVASVALETAPRSRHRAGHPLQLQRPRRRAHVDAGSLGHPDRRLGSQIWQWMYHDVFGVINDILVNRLHILDQKVAWLANPTTSLPAIIAVDVWKTTPFMALLLLAGLQIIPGDVYEAATVDGASKWQQFWQITLPLLKPALLVALIFRTLDAFRVFDVIYVMKAVRARDDDARHLCPADNDRSSSGSAAASAAASSSSSASSLFVIVYTPARPGGGDLGWPAHADRRTGADPAERIEGLVIPKRWIPDRSRSSTGSSSGSSIVFILFYTLFPFFWALVSSLKLDSQLFNTPRRYWPQQIDWSHLPVRPRNGDFLRALRNSVIVSVGDRADRAGSSARSPPMRWAGCSSAAGPRSSTSSSR